ncbi:MAG: Sodium/calcium exchanger protein-domain-containing protein [Piptocephalis tieghemiana]|nr:MAG: Sodium/calcium exchanger protein-domain-containing protein [Piptocephalis tieghemiana]
MTGRPTSPTLEHGTISPTHTDPHSLRRTAGSGYGTMPIAFKRSVIKKDAPEPTIMQSIRAFVLSSWINLLCVLIPIGFVSHYLHWNGIAIFVINFMAIVPLAKLLGYATEEVALRLGETVGALVNATFGNAVEVIVSIMALREGEIRVVQTSLIGSILSNILLVLGFCFFLGGIKYEEQSFNVIAAQTSSSLLTLSVLALIIPAAFYSSLPSQADNDTNSRILNLSHATAILLLVIYILYLIFQLKTHKHLYIQAPTEGAVTEHEHQDEEEEEEEEEPTMSFPMAIVALVIVTVLVAFHAEFLVDSIKSVTEGGALSQGFVGLILLPIVGNAAEHVTAVTTAMKNKMELAIGVAVGSSTQIALFVIPLLVIIGWGMGQPMTLFFTTFDTILLFLSILIANYLLQDGKSNWLEGAMLLISYAIVAVAVFYYPDTTPAHAA